MQIKVWNDNNFEYREQFRDKTIVIKPKSFVMMDFDEAQIFQGTYAGRMKTADGQDDPRGFKMIRLDVDNSYVPETTGPVFTCHADGRTFQTQAELDAHEKQYESRIVTDSVAEAEIKRRGRPPKKREATGGVSDTTTGRGSSTS